MAFGFLKELLGITFVPQNTDPPVAAGDVRYNSATNKLELFDTALRSISVEGGTPAFGSITLSDTTNQIILGTTNTVTLNSPAPSASRTYTIPDVGTNSSFLLVDGVQTINGIKNVGASLDFTEISTPANPSSGSLRIYPKTDGNLYTLNSSGLETQVGSPALIAASYTKGDVQTLTTDIDQVCLYDTLVIDTNSAFDTSTGIYTVPSTGTYFISAAVNTAIQPTDTSSTNTMLRLAVFKNGGGILQFQGYVLNPVQVFTVNVSGLASLTSGDQITFHLTYHQGNGSNTHLSVADNNEFTNFSIYKVG